MADSTSGPTGRMYRTTVVLLAAGVVTLTYVAGRVDGETVTPDSCFSALDTADRLGDLTVGLGMIGEGYVPLVRRAFATGVSGNAAEAETVTARLDALVDRSNALTGRAWSTVRAYRAAAEECRAVSEG